MTRFRSMFLAPVVFALAMALAPAASAGEAQDYVRGRHTELIQALKEAPSPARTARLGTLLDNMIDFDSIVQESLASNKDGRTDAELAEFRDLLQKLIKRNYQRNIQKTVDYTMTYEGEDPGTEGVIVHTKVEKTKASGEVEVISIDYRLHQKGGRWQVFDVITENSSMVSNYRNQFAKTIRKDGWNGLITKLKRKLAQPEPAGGRPTVNSQL